MKGRHGDVLVIGTSRTPHGKKRTNMVLAYGEVTGHRHEIIEGVAEVYDEADGSMLVVVLSETAVLDHQEHPSRELSRGTYEVVIQRDATAFGERKVVD